MTYERELEFARRAAGTVGKDAVQMRRAGIIAETKPDGSLVTLADRENERVLRELIESQFPGDAILGEEGTQRDGRSERRWVIDPIDGTQDFVRGSRFWCVLIALERAGESILGVAHFPMLGETYWGVRGQGAYCNENRLHVSSVDRVEEAVLSLNGLAGMSSEPYGSRVLDFMSRFRAVRALGGALDAVMLAAGKIDVWIERKAAVWDLAPLQVIVEEAGGRCCALDGTRRNNAGNAVAFTPGLEGEVHAFFRTGGVS